MRASGRVQPIQDVLGSAHIFASAVQSVMQERLRAVIGEQLSFSQLRLLTLIARTEAYSISQVAAFLDVSNAAASKAVDRLVRRDLLDRNEAASDRRTVELRLTAEGRGLLDEYEAVIDRTLEEIFGSIPRQELEETAEMLDRLTMRLIDHGGESEELCFRCGIYFREKCLLRTKRRRQCHFQLRSVAEPAAPE